MNDREREELEEVLAQLYDAEHEAIELYGGFPAEAKAARQTVEELLLAEREPRRKSPAVDVTLMGD